MSSKQRLLLVIVCLQLVVHMCVTSNDIPTLPTPQEGWVKKSWRYTKEFTQGSTDMWKAYWNMQRANWKFSDKYFHARGNYEAAKRGPGGRAAAEFISNAREWMQEKLLRQGPSDGALDQIANRWGREGRDPNVYRPAGLPLDYK